MGCKSHLPRAVEYVDGVALAALPRQHLMALLRECDQWLETMAAFRDAVQTRVGLTEWAVLSRQDIAETTAARIRVRAAIELASA